MMRRCPQCGFENPLEEEFCTQDNYPLFDVQPTTRACAENQESGSTCEDEDGQGNSEARVHGNEPTERFEGSCFASIESITEPEWLFSIWDGAVVGRGDLPDVDLWPAVRRRRVSRQHARFFYRNDCWYVENMPDITNNTAVNGERLEVGEQAAISEGDHIALADSVFLFHEQAEETR